MQNSSRAVSSVGEHILDMDGVTGSNPVPPTIFSSHANGASRSPAAAGERSVLCVTAIRSLRCAGVGHALLGEARLRRAMQVLSLGLIVAAFLGEAVERRAMQILLRRLHRAGRAALRHGGGREPERGDYDCSCFHCLLLVFCRPRAQSFQIESIGALAF